MVENPVRIGRVKDPVAEAKLPVAEAVFPLFSGGMPMGVPFNAVGRPITGGKIPFMTGNLGGIIRENTDNFGETIFGEASGCPGNGGLAFPGGIDSMMAESI